jgi:hypothetical protein
MRQWGSGRVMLSLDSSVVHDTGSGPHCCSFTRTSGWYLRDRVWGWAQAVRCSSRRLITHTLRAERSLSRKLLARWTSPVWR